MCVCIYIYIHTHTHIYLYNCKNKYIPMFNVSVFYQTIFRGRLECDLTMRHPKDIFK